MTPEEAAQSRMASIGGKIPAEESDEGFLAAVTAPDALHQQLREAEAKAAACSVALEAFLNWHGGLIPCRDFVKQYGMPPDNIATLERFINYGQAALAALPARATAMLAVVEAADVWNKAKRGTDHGESFCHASDALSAAVAAWRKAGGR
jgi:hypothetical protein